jgi:hypothetical protein
MTYYAYSIDNGDSFLSNDMSLRSEQEALDAAARHLQEEGAGKEHYRIYVGEIEFADEWIAKAMPRLLSQMLKRIQEDMVDDGYACDINGDVVQLNEQHTTELQKIMTDYLNSHGKYEWFSVSRVQKYFIEIRS